MIPVACPASGPYCIALSPRSVKIEIWKYDSMNLSYCAKE